MFGKDKIEDIIGICVESEELLNGQDELSRLIHEYANEAEGDLSENQLDQVTGGTRDIYVRVKERIEYTLIHLDR